MKTKTTYEKLFQFSMLAQAWVGRHKDNETKLGYAIKRMMPRVKELSQQYNQALEDINVDNCATDERGVILTDEHGQMRFTKDGLRERNKKQRELPKLQIEIEPYYATEVPGDLTDDEQEAFEGFVLKAEAEAAGA